MKRKCLKFKITGATPLLMHNGQMADPMNEFARKLKALTGKRNKTDEDYIEIAHVEWMGSLYVDGGKPCIPGEVLEAMLVKAAKKQKKGLQANAGLFCRGNFPLIYKGPKDLDKLWTDPRFRLTCGVKVKQARVMRTRPQFHEWAAEIAVEYNPSILNESDVRQFVAEAADTIGLMDWRPKFGLFDVAARK